MAHIDVSVCGGRWCCSVGYTRQWGDYLTVHVTIDYSLSERFSNQVLKTKECGKLRNRC